MITPSAENRSSIASRILEFESRNPGQVLIRVNPRMIPILATNLQEQGFKKRFLQSADQFIVDSALSYHKALVTVLEMSLLVGSNAGQGEFDCWYSNGEYAGWQGHFQLQDYEALAGFRVYAVITLSSLTAQMSDLLESNNRA